ncbi:MAG: Major facilitator superfamily MFS_1, partial [Thermovirga lienii]
MVGKDSSVSESLKKAYRYRWIVWGSMVLAYMVVFFHRLAAGVVKEDIINTFGLSYTEFGHLASMYFYAYMVMQIPVGILADSLGARITVSSGMLVAALGSVVFGLAKSVFAVFLGRFLVGIGVSVVFVCVLKVQSQWFREDEFASVSGATNLMGNLGGLVAQTPLALLVAAFTWRYTFVAIGALSAALAVLCFLLIRNKPQDMGFPPIHQEVPLEDNKKASVSSGLMEVIKDICLWPCFLYVPLVAGAYIAFTGAWGV